MMLALCNSLVTPNAATVNSDLPALSSLAIYGDSIAKQNNGLVTTKPGHFIHGMATQARILDGCRWDFTKNAATGRFTFAEDGYRTDQVRAAFRADCITAAPQAVMIGEGINNLLQGTNMATLVSDIIEDADAFAAAGIIPIIQTLLPVGLNFGSNVGGLISGRVATYNPLLRAAVAAAGYLLCDLEPLFELTPGSGDGIGDQTKFSDGLHPNPWGALIAGRFIKDWLNARFIPQLDPYTGYTPITPNFPYTVGSGPPTNWTLAAAPAGATTVSQSVINDPDNAGEKIWQLVLNQGASVGSFRAYCFAQLAASYATSDNCNGVMQVRTTVGGIHSMAYAAWTSGAQAAYPMYHGSTTGASYPFWETTDGWITLDGPDFAAGNPGSTTTWPELYFSTTPNIDTTVQFRRWGVCKR